MSEPGSIADELAAIVADLAGTVAWQQECGLKAAPVDPRRPTVAPVQPAQVQPIPVQPTPAPVAPVSEPQTSPPAVVTPSEMPDKWKAIADAPQAPVGLLVARTIGSTPSDEETLDKMLGNVLAIDRSDVLIVDVSDTNIAEGRHQLESTIARRRPSAVLVLGDAPARALFGSESTVSALRGRLHLWAGEHGDTRVWVTHHPADIRATQHEAQQQARREAFADLKQLCADLPE